MFSCHTVRSHDCRQLRQLMTAQTFINDTLFSKLALRFETEAQRIAIEFIKTEWCVIELLNLPNLLWSTLLEFIHLVAVRSYRNQSNLSCINGHANVKSWNYGIVGSENAINMTSNRLIFIVVKVLLNQMKHVLVKLTNKTWLQVLFAVINIHNRQGSAQYAVSVRALRCVSVWSGWHCGLGHCSDPPYTHDPPVATMDSILTSTAPSLTTT